MRTPSSLSSFATALILGALTYARPAVAGPADTPLPTFSDGKPAVTVYTAAGVIKNNNVETDFVCTNMDSAPRDIAIEVFDETGARRNNVNAGEGALLNVAPGETRTFGTSGTAALHEDVTLTLNNAGTGLNQLRNGSGRVVATSKSISCTAMLADKLHVIQDPATLPNIPPPMVVSLPLTRVP